jgi:hypothetical protein
VGEVESQDHPGAVISASSSDGPVYRLCGRDVSLGGREGGDFVDAERHVGSVTDDRVMATRW